MIKQYKRFEDTEARATFQTELSSTIYYCAVNCKDTYYADALCAIKDVYDNYLKNEIDDQMIMSYGAFLVVRNALVALSNEVLGEDEDFIGEQIGDLVELLDKAVGDGD